jgi:hypothetical protein
MLLHFREVFSRYFSLGLWKTFRPGLVSNTLLTNPSLAQFFPASAAVTVIGTSTVPIFWLPRSITPSRNV